MSDIEYSVIMSDVIKSFDCILSCLLYLTEEYIKRYGKGKIKWCGTAAWLWYGCMAVVQLHGCGMAACLLLSCV